MYDFVLNFLVSFKYWENWNKVKHDPSSLFQKSLLFLNSIGQIIYIYHAFPIFNNCEMI